MNEEDVTIADRLNSMLADKDKQIGKLRDTMEELRQSLRGAETKWTLHTKLDGEQTLPVPRLELFYEADGYEGREWCEFIVYYRLVYRHLLGHTMAVPLGETSIKGGNGEAPIRDGKIDLPFRDGCHIRNEMKCLNLPGYAICGDVTEQLAQLPPQA